MARVVTDQSARQAPPGRPVLVVLIASLALCAALAIGFVVWNTATAPPTPAQSTTQPSSSSGNTSTVPAGNPAYPTPAEPKSGTPGAPVQ